MHDIYFFTGKTSASVEMVRGEIGLIGLLQPADHGVIGAELSGRGGELVHLGDSTLGGSSCAARGALLFGLVSDRVFFRPP